MLQISQYGFWKFSLPALLVAVIFFPISLKYLAILILLVTAIKFSNAEPKSYSNLDTSAYRFYYLVAFTFLIWMLISALWSPAPFSLAINHVVHFAIVLLPLFVISKTSPMWFFRAYQVIPYIALISAVLLLLAYLGYGNYMPKILEGYGLYQGNKAIAIASATAICAGICFIEALKQEFFLRDYKFYIAIFITLLFVLTSTSRGSLLVLLMAFGLSFVFLIFRKCYARALIPLLMIVCVCGFTVLNESVVSKFERASNDLTNVEDNNSDARVELYRVTYQLIKDRSFVYQIIGEGAGSWNIRYPQIAEGLSTERMTTAHNDFLQVLMQNGVIGLVLFLLIFFALFQVILKSTKAYEVPVFMLCAIVLMTFVHAGVRDTKIASSLFLLFIICFSASIVSFRRR